MREQSKTMTRNEARKCLGLKKRDRVADYLPRWLEAEERLAMLVVSTEDLEQRARYEADLVSLGEVLKTLKETPERQRPPFGMWVWAVVLLAIAVAGLVGYQKWVGIETLEKPVVSLVQQKEALSQAIENRRWDEAQGSIEELKAAGVNDALLAEAVEKILLGKKEEKGQQIGFLIGNAQAALEAGRLTKARDFCDQVEDLEPDHPKLAELRSLISEGLLQVRSLLIVKALRKAISKGDLDLADNNLVELVKINSEHVEIPVLRERIGTERERMKKDQEAVGEFLAKARKLDTGVYSGEALEFLKEAMRLDPNKEVRELYLKMSGYGRVIRVPKEFKTIAGAIEAAGKNDRILIAKGTYEESLIIPPGIELVGESRKSTILEFEGGKGSVITLNQSGTKVRLASLTLRHKGLANDEERFPVVAISSGVLELEDSTISGASGHGLAVIDGGSAQLAQCDISKSGWDGVAVKGENSRATLENVSLRENLHHGVDFWEGGSGEITSCQFLKNGRSGMVVLAPDTKFSISSCRSEGNREVGLFFSRIPELFIEKCEVSGNLLGGIVIQDESRQITLVGNTVTKNGEAGVVLEKGGELAAYENNVVKENTGKQLWKDAVFPALTSEEDPPPPAPPFPKDGE
jgi:parallel beta-helix repeat protein